MLIWTARIYRRKAAVLAVILLGLVVAAADRSGRAAGAIRLSRQHCTSS